MTWWRLSGRGGSCFCAVCASRRPLLRPRRLRLPFWSAARSSSAHWPAARAHPWSGGRSGMCSLLPTPTPALVVGVLPLPSGVALFAVRDASPLWLARRGAGRPPLVGKKPQALAGSAASNWADVQYGASVTRGTVASVTRGTVACVTLGQGGATALNRGWLGGVSQVAVVLARVSQVSDEFASLCPGGYVPVPGWLCLCPGGHVPVPGWLCEESNRMTSTRIGGGTAAQTNWKDCDKWF